MTRQWLLLLTSFVGKGGSRRKTHATFHMKMCILNHTGNFDCTYPSVPKSNFTVRWPFYDATLRAAIFKNSWVTRPSTGRVRSSQKAPALVIESLRVAVPFPQGETEAASPPFHLGGEGRATRRLGYIYIIIYTHLVEVLGTKVWQCRWELTNAFIRRTVCLFKKNAVVYKKNYSLYCSW